MSKRSEEKKKQEYYRKRIGEKLEEAYLSIPMGDPPSEETIKKWIEIADKRRARKARRKRILLSSAAAVVLCVGLCATCILQTPEAVAGNSGGVKVETGAQSKDTYASLEDLPDNIKDEFLIFSDMPDGYSLKEATVEKDNNLQILQMNYSDINNEEITIKEKKPFSKDNNVSVTINFSGEKEVWEDIDVYIRGYDSGEENITYNLVCGDIQIKIMTSRGIEKNKVEEMVKKAIWG